MIEDWSQYVIEILQERAEADLAKRMVPDMYLMEIRPKLGSLGSKPLPERDVESSDESVKSPPIQACTELRKLKEQEQMIVQIEQQFRGYLSANTIADSIGLLKPEELRLLQRARGIRASIANMTDDVELQPSDLSI